MKRGWLLYTQENADKNEWFIARLHEELLTYGVEIMLKIIPKTGDFHGEFAQNLPDFAIVRSICPKLNVWLERRGVKVFNNAETAKIACDKRRTYVFCKAHKIPVLSTWKRKSFRVKYPFVMKTVDGHGGTEVFWIKDKIEYSRKKKALKGRQYILQTPCDTLGKDMRVYVIGGGIVGAVMRSSQNDFRSNFSLGGSVELAQVDETQIAIVQKLCNAIQPDYIGVDFLPHKGGWVLNEIEDSAGARMLYACSDVDVVKVYAEHIVKSI